MAAGADAKPTTAWMGSTRRLTVGIPLSLHDLGCLQILYRFGINARVAQSRFVVQHDRHCKSLTECTGFAVRLSGSCKQGNLSVETEVHNQGHRATAASCWQLTEAVRM